MMTGSDRVDMNNLRIGFVGAGVLGNGLSLALSSKGYQIVAISSRSFSSAKSLSIKIPNCYPVSDPQKVADSSDLVMITTPDSVVSLIASQIQWNPSQAVIHCSGSLTLECLSHARDQGALTGSLHPFQTFAGIESFEDGMVRLQGSTFTVEGDGWLGTLLDKIVSDLGGRLLNWDPKYRALYHASAVLSCGYVVALLEAACSIWQSFGYSTEDALTAILPITKNTLEAASGGNLKQIITGPIIRGDIQTVERHLVALGESLPDLVPLYCVIGLQSIRLASPTLDGHVIKKLDSLLKNCIQKYAAYLHE